MLCVPDALGTAAVTVNFYSTSLHSRYLSLYTLPSLKSLPMHCKSYPIYFIKHTIWACPLVKYMSWFANLDWEKSAAINKHLKHAYPLRPLWKDLSRVRKGGSLLRVHNPRHYLLPPPSLPSTKKWGCHLNWKLLVNVWSYSNWLIICLSRGTNGLQKIQIISNTVHLRSKTVCSDWLRMVLPFKLRWNFLIGCSRI